MASNHEAMATRRKRNATSTNTICETRTILSNPNHSIGRHFGLSKYMNNYFYTILTGIEIYFFNLQYSGTFAEYYYIHSKGQPMQIHIGSD